MKRAVSILKAFLLGFCALAFFLLFCTYSIPGALLWFFFREHYPRWNGSAIALSVAVLFRIVASRWNFVIGDGSFGAWWLEVMQGAVSWAIGAILVAGGYQLVAFLVKRWGRREHAPIPPAAL